MTNDKVNSTVKIKFLSTVSIPQINVTETINLMGSNHQIKEISKVTKISFNQLLKFLREFRSITKLLTPELRTFHSREEFLSKCTNL